MALCQACGVETRWVEVDGERIALDTIPTPDGEYALDPEDIEKAHLVDRDGRIGYTRHDKTCPMKVRERERREGKL